MGVSKIDYNGETLIDLTGDSVAINKMLEGTIAHGANGEILVGNIPNNGDLSQTVDIGAVTSIIIPAGYTSGGVITLKQITHYYYNGVLLPKLPAEAATHPYQWIRKNNSTKQYDLIMSVNRFWFDSTRLTDGGTGDLYFRLDMSSASTATSWGSQVSNSYSGWSLDGNRTVMWSSFDVMQSQTSTTVYFAGSNPVPA